ADKATEAARRRGVLLASGFLVGESFVGVILAVADTLAGRSAALALVGPDFASYATWMGLAVFASGLAVFYRLTARAEPDEAVA
ncbi:oligopeptide transporter, OPT family, partial [Methylobacterium sp. WL103]